MFRRQDNQIRFPGYKLISGNFVNKKVGVCVNFGDEGQLTFWGPGFHCDFENGCSVFLFEKLLEIKER